MTGKTVEEAQQAGFDNTKCKVCGTDKPPLYLRSPARDMNDFFCEEHKESKEALGE